MAKNPFARGAQNHKENVRVSNHDWTHSFNFSTNVGRITPVFTEIVPPHTSLSIDPHLGMQFMPLAFPVQTPMKARISFFKIPVRALWRDYEDYVSVPGSTTLEEPYFGISNAMTETDFQKWFGTGSLLDMMNVPTTYDAESVVYSQKDGDLTLPNPTLTTWQFTLSSSSESRITLEDYLRFNKTSCGTKFYGKSVLPPDSKGDAASAFSCVFNLKKGSATKFEKGRTLSFEADLNVVSSSNPLLLRSFLQGCQLHIRQVFSDYSMPFTSFSPVKVTSVGDGSVFHIATEIPLTPLCDDSSSVNYSVTLVTNSANFKPVASVNWFFSNVQMYADSNYTKANCPWYNKDTKKGIKLSAYPLRAYHAIYNAYYRNARNNPLMVNGKPQYNKWVVNRDSGGNDCDSWPLTGATLDEYFSYKYANWEMDAFTSCVQRPQAFLDPEHPDRAPLVGITDYATKVTSVGDDGVAVERSILKSYLTDEDGHSYEIGFTKNDKEKVVDVSFTRADLPSSEKRITSTYDAVQQGIRIEDFRNVNALQLYLEHNNRSEFSYKSITEGRYNVRLSYEALLMPEFCGGFTRDVSISTVMQTVNQQDGSGDYIGALGSRAGDAVCRGDGNKIRVFCDEESVVMGLLVVTPQPVYSQHLPRFWQRRSLFDRFNPEFANIGMQPVRLKDVAPIQAFMNFTDLPVKPTDGYAALEQTFGYNTAWWEYFTQFDTCHGLFRESLRNFLMSRVFAGVPQLGKKFTTIDPNDVDNVFAVTEYGDKIIGSVFFQMTCKSIVPDWGVPRLE